MKPQNSLQPASSIAGRQLVISAKASGVPVDVADLIKEPLRDKVVDVLFKLRREGVVDEGRPRAALKEVCTIAVRTGKRE